MGYTGVNEFDMILVLGAGGLLGYHLTTLHELSGVVHEDCDICSPDQIVAAIETYEPRVIINCAAITNKVQVPPGKQFMVNSYGPKLLAMLCDQYGIKLVHISSNAVFGGENGPYLETNMPNPKTIYGLSKYLGEITHAPHLTIRTSIVGWPDPHKRGVLGWLFDQSSCDGYGNVLWNGVTTVELGRLLFEVILPRNIQGLLHVCSEQTISKLELLRVARDVYRKRITIQASYDHSENFTLGSVYAEGYTDNPIRRQLEEMRNIWSYR
jgi:dTDP-4-dehydrorhamnose reductase